MIIISIAIGIALLILALTQYLDVNSTKQGIKKNLTHEANPAVAWLMKTFPKSWGWIKGAGILAVGVAVVWFLPPTSALILLTLMDALFLYAALQNYQLSDGPPLN